MKVRLEFKKEDLWVGVYWRGVPWADAYWRYDIWLCVLPCLPVHVTWYRERAK